VVILTTQISQGSCGKMRFRWGGNFCDGYIQYFLRNL